ncbi:excisionase [Bradyrhizobium sp. USDA 3364]
MTKRDANIDLSAIGPTTPLRLEIAARIAYPDGSMTKSGLRREIARGHLDCERVAGKQYVTLAGIEQMRVLCRGNRKVPASTSANAEDAKQFGSSSMEETRSALVAAQTIAEALKRPSPTTSPPSTNQTGKIVTLQR